MTDGDCLGGQSLAEADRSWFAGIRIKWMMSSSPSWRACGGRLARTDHWSTYSEPRAGTVGLRTRGPTTWMLELADEYWLRTPVYPGRRRRRRAARWVAQEPDGWSTAQLQNLVHWPTAAPELQVFAVAAYKYVISVDVALRRTSACPRQLSCSTGVGGMESQPGKDGIVMAAPSNAACNEMQLESLWVFEGADFVPNKDVGQLEILIGDTLIY